MSRSDLLINISNLPPNGRRLEGSLPEEEINRTLADTGGGLKFVTPVGYSLTLNRVQDNMIMEASLGGEYETGCSRCLEPAKSDFALDFRQIFIPAPEDFRPEAEKADDVEQLSFYRSDEIDLTPVIFEQIFLSLPNWTLCREDCPGLCHDCGHNLNQGPCGCNKDKVDPRLAALKNFKVSE